MRAAIERESIGLDLYDVDDLDLAIQTIRGSTALVRNFRSDRKLRRYVIGWAARALAVEIVRTGKFDTPLGVTLGPERPEVKSGRLGYSGDIEGLAATLKNEPTAPSFWADDLTEPERRLLKKLRRRGAMARSDSMANNVIQLDFFAGGPAA